MSSSAPSADGAFLLADVPIHLGLGPTATPLPGFGWSAEALAAYEARFASDGDEGRLLVTFRHESDWTVWERHPAGDEIVICISGRGDLVQEVDGQERRVGLSPGSVAINAAGVWHTMDVAEAGDAIFITPGLGTEHRPR